MFTSSFVHDRKYFVGDSIRYRFYLSTKQPIYKMTTDAIMDKYDYLEDTSSDNPNL